MTETAAPSFDATLAAWEAFFTAQLGAGAALLGLLFVGLSLNLDRILADPNLPRRAEIGLVLLVLQLIVSSVALMPDQSPTAVGIEILAIAGVAWLLTTGLSVAIVRSAPGPTRNSPSRTCYCCKWRSCPTLPARRCCLPARGMR